MNTVKKTLLDPAAIKKYVKMKSIFGDRANDPKLITNTLHIINTVILNNENIAFNKLVDQFGEEYANASVSILFSAYLDGYLDPKQSVVRRLYNERRAH